MKPMEDRGPAWMQDYGFDDFQVNADITAMEQFAAKLHNDVANNYDPHAAVVVPLMTTATSAPVEYSELYSFLFVHREAQMSAANNIYYFSSGTSKFAEAAQQVSKDYRGSDAFAHAKVSDVEDAFNAAAGTDGTLQ